MPATFQYKVKDKSGKLVEGSLEAENAQLVVSKLRSMGYVPIEIQQTGGPGLQKELKLPGLSDRVKLKDVSVFPAMVVHMVGVGEETGALDTMLTKIADFYEEEVNAAIKALTSILEPVMIILIGGIVGFIVISMYLSLFKVYDQIK